MVGHGKIKGESPKGFGFSLVEAMVALLILMIGLGGLIASFQTQVSKSVASRNQAQAAIIASSVLTELSDSDPSGWPLDGIKKFYVFNYDGERVAADASDIYYEVELGDPTRVQNYWDVEIGVTWTGWRDEQSKTGAGNENADFAYVLNTSISPFVSIGD